MAWGTVELEPEVEEWLLSLFRKHRAQEGAEIERAERAMERCGREGHTAED